MINVYCDCTIKGDNRIRLKTDMKAEMFIIECLNCGALVEISEDKAEHYERIKS